MTFFSPVMVNSMEENPGITNEYSCSPVIVKCMEKILETTNPRHSKHIFFQSLGTSLYRGFTVEWF